jgi:hypothetical protein
MVKIDGKLVCQTTPCQRVVDEGQREIILQKDLYSIKTQMINVQRGKDIKIYLDPDFGWLEIKSPYDGVDVFLDGKHIGRTPIQKIQVSSGEHIIEPKGDCFNTVQEQIIVEKLRVESVNLDVQQKKAAIDITVKDEKGNDIEADVFVDGKNVGRAPKVFQIPMCSEKIVVKAISGNEYEKDLVIRLKENETYPIYAIIKDRNAHQQTIKEEDSHQQTIKEEDSYLNYKNDKGNSYNNEYHGIYPSENKDKTNETEYSAPKIKKVKKTRPYVNGGIGLLVLGVISFGGAGLSQGLISIFNDQARTEFSYGDTAKTQEFLERARSAEKARNVLLGIGAGFSTLGIIMFFITKEQPVAVYVDDKGFMLSYNFKF